MVEKIGQILIRSGRVSSEQIRHALSTQQQFGGFLGSHLITLGYLDEDELGRVLSEIHGVSAISLEELESVPKQIRSLLPSAEALRFRALPLRVDGNRLHVAIANPRDDVALGRIASLTGLNVAPHVAPDFRIVQALERLYDARPAVRRRTPPPPAPDATGSDRVVPFFSERPGERLIEPDDAPYSGSGSTRIGREASLSGAPSGDAHASPTLDDLPDRLDRAVGIAGASLEIVSYAVSHFRRAVLAAVLSDRSVVLDAASADSSGIPAPRSELPALPASLSEAFESGAAFQMGGAGLLHGASTFSQRPGDLTGARDAAIPEPVASLLLPLTIHARVAAVLHADNVDAPLGPTDMQIWKRFAHVAGTGLELQLVRRRLRSLP